MGSKSAGRDALARRGAAAGAEALESRFLLAGISGTVFEDADLDGRRDAGEPGSRLAVYLDANGNRLFDQENLSFDDFRRQDVPDAGRLRSTVVASGVDEAEGTLLRFGVLIDLGHTRQSDVTAALVGPSGRRVELFSGLSGGGNAFNYVFLHDGAETSVNDGTGNFGGEYRPAEPLAPLLAGPLDGNWTLEITDGAAGETGYLLNWSVNFLMGERMVVPGAEGRYAFDDLPAGAYTARLALTDGVAQTLPALDGGHALTLAAGDAATGRDFASFFVGQNVVTGTVYDDADADGVFDAGEAPLAGRTVYFDANVNGVYDPNVVVHAATDLPKPTNREETYSRIAVAGPPDVSRYVGVTVDIAHAAPEEIRVTVIAPNGNRLDLGHRLPSYENKTFSRLYFGERATNGTWTLEVEDEEGAFRGTMKAWNISFTVGHDEYAVATDAQGRYRFEHDGNFGVVASPGETQSEPAGGGTRAVAFEREDQAFVRNFGLTRGRPAASVVGRHVFYDGSAFDRSPAGDDAAVATDKTALLPGGAASFANYTSYARGINGVMVDVARLPAGASLTAADFSFRTGSHGDLATWAPLASPAVVTVRPGGGADGSSRVSLVWPQGAVRNAWLRVTVLANERTGLAAPDVFYFGNLVGETGNPSPAASVTAADVVAVRAASGRNAVGANSPFDFDRDGRVGPLDQVRARLNLARSLHLLSTTSTQAAAAQASYVAHFGDAPVSPAGRRTAYRPARAWQDAGAHLLA